MKNFSFVVSMLTMSTLLPAPAHAEEIGEFCWDFTYFSETGNWNIQLTKHGNLFAAHGKDISSDGVENRQSSIMGSGYVVDNEVRMSMFNIAMNEPYGIDDISMGHGVFVVNLSDLSGTYHFTEEDIDACLPDAAPCAKAIPFTSAACQ